MERIRELYSSPDLRSFPATVLSVVSKLIPLEIATYDEVSLLENRCIHLESPSCTTSAKDLVVFEKYMHEHPYIYLKAPEKVQSHPFGKKIEKWDKRNPAYKRSPGNAAKISDVLTRNQFHMLSLYNEFFRKYDVEYQIHLPLVFANDSIVGVTLNRKLKDFSEKERLLLNLIAPHIMQAYANLTVIDRIKGNIVGHVDESRLNLTGRELEILQWTARGKSNADIAAILHPADSGRNGKKASGEDLPKAGSGKQDCCVHNGNQFKNRFTPFLDWITSKKVPSPTPTNFNS